MRLFKRKGNEVISVGASNACRNSDNKSLSNGRYYRTNCSFINTTKNNINPKPIDSNGSKSNNISPKQNDTNSSKSNINNAKQIDSNSSKSNNNNTKQNDSNSSTNNNKRISRTPERRTPERRAPVAVSKSIGESVHPTLRSSTPKCSAPVDISNPSSSSDAEAGGFPAKVLPEENSAIPSQQEPVKVEISTKLPPNKTPRIG